LSDATGTQKLFIIVLALAAIAFTVSMVLHSELAFKSALAGLKLWWEVVFPALLPFFIGSEILMGLGVVHFMGVLLEPLMRPLFNVPGAGSFVTAMGLASGYPIGAILTGRLRRQGLVSKTEGERLMSFSNTADPLFMSGAVAVGMFGMPELAAAIMLSHYTATLSVGLVLRFYGPADDITPKDDEESQGLMTKAFQRLYEARLEDGRPVGQLLGDSVRRSVNTLLVIGGFIILFSVILKILGAAQLTAAISGSLAFLLKPLGVNAATIPALVDGLFEVTLGCQTASGVNAPLAQQAMAAGAVIAWSGLSVHAQVASFINDTDMSILPFTLARLLHAFLAGFLTFKLISLPILAKITVVPVSIRFGIDGGPAGWLGFLGLATKAFLLVTAALLVAGALTWFWRSIRLIHLRIRVR